MKLKQSLNNFFFRFLVYFVVVLWPYIKIKDINNQTELLIQKIKINFNYFHCHKDFLKPFVEDPSLFLLIYGLFEFAAGIFAMFGSFYAGLISIILFIFSNFIYFNPLLSENKISLYNTREEVFFNIGILASLIVVTYYPYEEDKITNTENEEPKENNSNLNKKGKKKKKISSI